mmetsp:Transcript_8092/g.20162  ORF Transcript_8092/g.20162 Transcript_8092/m.20162 type:complete len:345 (+) Transcript_8092:190-1224(+)
MIAAGPHNPTGTSGTTWATSFPLLKFARSASALALLLFLGPKFSKQLRPDSGTCSRFAPDGVTRDSARCRMLPEGASALGSAASPLSKIASESFPGSNAFGERWMPKSPTSLGEAGPRIDVGDRRLHLPGNRMFGKSNCPWEPPILPRKRSLTISGLCMSFADAVLPSSGKPGVLQSGGTSLSTESALLPTSRASNVVTGPFNAFGVRRGGGRRLFGFGGGIGLLKTTFSSKAIPLGTTSRLWIVTNLLISVSNLCCVIVSSDSGKFVAAKSSRLMAIRVSWLSRRRWSASRNQLSFTLCICGSQVTVLPPTEFLSSFFKAEFRRSVLRSSCGGLAESTPGLEP